MRTAEEQRRYLQELVNGKIYWGEPDEQVLRWLAIERGVQGEEAEAFIHEAHRERRASVRKRASVGLLWSTLGLFIGGAVIIITSGAGLFLTLGWGTFFISIAWFFKSLWQLMSGQMTGSVGDTD